MGATPVEVRPFALCVDQLELFEELRTAENPQGGRVAVSLAAPGELLVRVSWPDGQRLERRVPARPKECAAVRRVVLALVRAWLAAPPAPLAPKPRPADPPTRVEPPLPLPPRVPAAPPVEPISEPPPPPIPEPELPDAPTHELLALAEPLPPPPPVHWRVGVGALGGGMAGTTAALAGAGSFFVEATRDHALGVGLEGGLETSRTPLAPSVYASQRWLTLYARGAVGLSERVRLAATLGLRGWAVDIGAPAVGAGRTLLGGGFAFTVGPEVALGPVELLIRVAFAGRFPEDRIFVGGNKVLFLKWWQVGALAGLAWHFP